MKNKILLLLNSSIIYIFLIILGIIFSIGFVEQKANSFLIRNFAAVEQADQDIFQIVVDDNSVQKYSSWPLGMYYEIFDYFYSYAKPKTIGFDMNVDSVDESNAGDRKFLSIVKKMDNLVFALVPEITFNNSDKSFIKDFQKKYALDTSFKIPDKESPYDGIISSSEILINTPQNYGSVIANSDMDSSYVFGAINLVKVDESYFPTLALKMYMLENKTNRIEINENYFYIPKTGLKVPYYNFSEGVIQSLIRFYPCIIRKGGDIADYSHNHISAFRIIDTYRALKSGITPENHPEKYDLQKGLVDPSIFKDSTIFIGANLSNMSADVVKTPMAQRHQGVDVQATIYDNLKHGYFLSNTGFGVAFLSFILLSLLTFVIIYKFNFIKGLISILTIDLIYLIIVCITARNGYLMTYATPIINQFITAVFAYSFKFITENRNKEKIKQAMGKYISQDIMKNVVNNIDDLKLGGKRAVVTVLFSDIRGFTSLSEKMPAEEVSVILNEYFAEMEPIISKYNGVINKFIGDAVMAIFGEPIHDEKHPQNAVKCAYEMLKKVEYLREKWIFEGKPKIEIGIGINTGEVFIGNIGTETRMEYTVIGDTVNLASRIESYNKVYKTNLLVSATTYSHISQIADVIKISDVQIRGKSKKMNIYEVLRLNQEKTDKN